ncbi:hypothetical protein [Collinsella ihumii]|uniref:Uncharacterized protein n=1 Tax=Collinsella ihumii TaxID=1720204 RepID=A0ABT7XHG3_9ACTN|nr:hypothetical protein [Collinsella ihumii]MDN0064849.1 hypothetical protein [Collinsella ihumii]
MLLLFAVLFCAAHSSARKTTFHRFSTEFSTMARNGGDGMIAPTTRDGARELFASKLSYEQITTNDIRALEGFLAIEYAQHERNGEHMEMHPCYRKKYQPQINLADGGRGIRSAFLRVSGFYFSGREAISFNEDGFIGIAGWADDTNVKPFLRAFHKWVCEWMIGVTYR